MKKKNAISYPPRAAINVTNRTGMVFFELRQLGVDHLSVAIRALFFLICVSAPFTRQVSSRQTETCEQLPALKAIPGGLRYI